jgi:hypothetical protein
MDDVRIKFNTARIIDIFRNFQHVNSDIEVYIKGNRYLVQKNKCEHYYEFFETDLQTMTNVKGWYNYENNMIDKKAFSLNNYIPFYFTNDKTNNYSDIHLATEMDQSETYPPSVGHLICKVCSEFLGDELLVKTVM